MNHSKMIKNLKKRTDALRQAQAELDKETLLTTSRLDEFIHEMDAVNIRLRELKEQSPAAPPKPLEPVDEAPPQDIKPAEAKAPDTGEKFERNLEKLLQESLDALGDKISDRLLNMMKELAGTAGPQRAAMIKQIKAAADSELVDLSSLFMHDEVKSNIQEIGIEEKEAKGIDKSLEKLRQMKQKKEK